MFSLFLFRVHKTFYNLPIIKHILHINLRENANEEPAQLSNVKFNPHFRDIKTRSFVQFRVLTIHAQEGPELTQTEREASPRIQSSLMMIAH